MPRFITCPKGHSYDADKSESCPVCKNAAASDKTLPIGSVFPTFETEPVNPPVASFNGSFTEGPVVDEIDEPTMPHVYSSAETARPVVGWLVCTSGPSKGQDYRIFPGFNSIGRSASMDIAIEGDDQISREREARIAYDTESRTFYFSPAEGKSILRVNSKVAMVPVELQPFDQLTIGSTKLLFVPLCGEKFNWDD